MGAGVNGGYLPLPTCPQRYCSFNPSPYRALLQYVEYLRDNGPVEPQCDSFFINCRGKELDKVIPYLQAISEDAKIPNVTVMKLRSLIETDNFFQSTRLANVSGHLGHNMRNGLQYYVSPQKEHAANAVGAITDIVEERGEKKYVAPIKTLWNPVSEWGSTNIDINFVSDL